MSKQTLNQTHLPIIWEGKIFKNKENDKKTSRILVLILIIVLSLLLLFCGYSLAKTVEEVIVKNETLVAKPIFTVDNNPELDITASNNYGIYTFKVKNYNENNETTDVDLNYYIELIYNKDDSINVELYETEGQNQKKIELKDNKTEYQKISKGEKQEKHYIIKITYDKEKNNKSMQIADIMQKMQIKIHTEQGKG